MLALALDSCFCSNAIELSELYTKYIKLLIHQSLSLLFLPVLFYAVHDNTQLDLLLFVVYLFSMATQHW